jgi:hypothetical protein
VSEFPYAALTVVGGGGLVEEDENDRDALYVYRYEKTFNREIHEIGWQRGSHTENEVPPVKGLCSQPVSGNLVVCAGRIRKPPTSCILPEIHQLHEAVNMPTILSFSSLLWSLINRVDHMLALSPQHSSSLNFPLEDAESLPRRGPRFHCRSKGGQWRHHGGGPRLSSC